MTDCCPVSSACDAAAQSSGFGPTEDLANLWMHFYMALFEKTLARPNMSDRILVSYHKASVSHNNAVKGLNEGCILAWLYWSYVALWLCRGGKAG